MIRDYCINFILWSFQFQYQPLHLACENGQTQMVKILVSEFAADPNAKAEVVRFTHISIA